MEETTVQVSAGQGATNTPPGEAMQFPSVNPRTAHSMGKESYRVNL
jgi:hypothetical protein